MRQRLSPLSPRKVATLPRCANVHFRVLTGDALVAQTSQELIDGGGLPIAITDGIVSLEWQQGELWLSAGGSADCVLEVIVP